ncbi:MAG: hypothetical protein ACOX6U_10895 [Oscillospiraceae bacterium]
MKQLHELFKETFDRQPVPQHLLDMQQYQVKSRRIRRRIPRYARIVIAVILAAAICSGTVLSYRYFSERYDSHFENMTHEDIDSGRVVANGSTSIRGNLAITVNAVTGDAKIAYFDITVKSMDGTPLLREFGERTYGEDGNFEKSYLEFENGETSHLVLVPVENGSSATLLKYEGTAGIPDSVSLAEGCNATIHLGKFYQDSFYFEGLGFASANVAELLEQGIPCQEFATVKNPDGWSGTDKTYRYTLPEGENRIYFSERYPTAYIDNFGFIPSGGGFLASTDYEEEPELYYADWLYLSIVPGTGGEALETVLKGLQLYSTDENGERNYLIATEIAQESDGRLVLGFRTGTDENVTPELLRNIQMCSIHSSAKAYYNNETFQIPISLSYNQASVTKKINVSTTYDGLDFTIHSLNLTNAKVNMDGTYANGRMEFQGCKQAKLILTNGDVVLCGDQFGGSTRDGSYSIDWFLPEIIDVSEVAAFEIWGVQIPVK